MTAYNVTTSFDTKTRVLTAARGRTRIEKQMPGVVISRDHGLLAGEVIKSCGGVLPMRLVLDSTKTAVGPNGFKFHVVVEKP